jgi:hypothetical protein
VQNPPALRGWNEIIGQKLFFSEITFLMLTHMYFDCAISEK